MQLIVQSSFLKALAFSLTSSMWQMALMWLIIMLVFRIFKLNAAQKFNTAFAGQLTGVFLFVYTLFHYKASADISIHFRSNIFYADKLHNYINASMPYVGIIYLVMLMYQFSKLLYSYNSTQRLRKYNLKKMPAINRIFIQEITALLSLKKHVSIYLSSTIQCPLTIGFFKPIILVPLAAVNHLTKEQMEAVLLHEMAHIKRYDYLLNIIQSLIEKIFFFNIFSKMIHDIIEHERENACDDFVLQFRYNAFHYAEALLKLGRLQTMSAFAMAASGKKESMLLLRIKRLIHHKNHNNNYSLKTLAYCFCVLIIALPLMFSSLSIINKSHATTSKTNKASIIPVLNKQEAFTQKPFTIKSFANNVAIKSAVKQFHKKEINKLHFNTEQVPGYFADVRNSMDSFKQPAIIEAINKNIVLNNDTYKKALSYQNFKQLEAMLQASSKLITITEDPASKDSYKKLITIEATDAQGNKNIYKVIVELYQ